MFDDWRQLAVLVVGCGSIGRWHLRVLHELGVADLRACDPSAAARSQAAEEVVIPKKLIWVERGASQGGQKARARWCERTR